MSSERNQTQFTFLASLSHEPNQTQFTFSTSFRHFMIGLHALVMAVGCLGTITLLVVFASHKSLWKPSYVFIGFLAFIDLLHLTLVGTFKICSLINGDQWLDESICCLTAVLTFQLMTASMFVTVLIAVNRYTRVCFSNADYEKVFALSKVSGWCILVLVASGLFTIDASTEYYPSLPGCFLDVRRCNVRIYLNASLYFLGCLLLIGLYKRMMSKVRHVSMRSRPSLITNRSITLHKSSGYRKTAVAVISETSDQTQKAVDNDKASSGFNISDTQSTRRISFAPVEEPERTPRRSLESKVSFENIDDNSTHPEGKLCVKYNSAAIEGQSLISSSPLSSRNTSEAPRSPSYGQRRSIFRDRGNKRKHVEYRPQRIPNLMFGFVACTLNMALFLPFLLCFIFKVKFSWNIPEEAACVTHLLLLCGSAFNCLIYGAMNTSFQEAGKDFVLKKRRKFQTTAGSRKSGIVAQ